MRTIRTIEVDNEIAYECKDHQNYFITKTGILYSILVKGGQGETDINNPRKMAYGQDKDGYYRVVLSHNAKHTYIKIHTLVVKQFIGDIDIENGFVVNHIDGNKHNNNVENLEIITNLENIQHAWNNGLIDCSKNPLRVPVLVKDNVENKYLNFGSLSETSKSLGISLSYLRFLKNNQNEIHYGYCTLIKRMTENEKYYIDCYYNGQLVKSFNGVKEAGKFFNKAPNTISSYHTKPNKTNMKYNRYTITFPNVSTIENTFN